MKRYSRSSRIVLVLLVGLFILLALSLQSVALTVQTGSFRIDLQGKKTWTVKLGFGDGKSLSRVGYPKDSYSLAQTLKVNTTGQLGKYFSLSANLDDTKPGYLQKFELKMDTDNWDGRLGDLSTGEDNFTVYNKKLLGLELTGKLGESELSAVAGRLQGISETKVFYGNTGESEVEYSLYRSEARLEESGYTNNIRGLQYYKLAIDYVEGFTDPELGFQADDDLWNFLDQWEFGCLKGEIEAKPSSELSSGQFDVVSREIDYLILLEDWRSLIRKRIKSYITRYNQDLPEEEKKEYPFNPGTDYEENFLGELSKYVNLTLGESQLQLNQYKQTRFYYLGRTEIKEEGFQLEILRNGEWEKVRDIPGYDFNLYPEKGLVGLAFPEEFFADLANKRIRARFQYEISGKMYSLGLSVAPNSERVYLNGNLLKRNTDYSIDYETGSLLIFKDVGADDKLKVDFERARGGLGGFAQFARTMYGFSTRMKSDYGLVMDVSLFQARDNASEELPPEIPTMPNLHTVGGVSARYEENGWTASVKFAGNVNRFPSDDNSRVNLPNRIVEILSLTEAGYEKTLFAHKNGFTIKGPEGWESYGPEDGLAGNNVNDGLIVGNQLFLGTNAGLTKVELTGPAPLARAPNWESYYETDGLPKGEVVGLASDGDRVWAASQTNISETTITALAEDGGWDEVPSEFDKDFSLLSIAYVDGHLWLGTDQGLYLYDISRGELTGTEPAVAGRVNDMEVVEKDLYVATPDGITKIGLGKDKEELVKDRSVKGLSVEGGEVWFGTDRGFAKVGSPVRYGRKSVTAILATGSKVRAGSKGYRSDETSEIVVYELENGLEKFYTDQTKIKGIDDDQFRSIDPEAHTDKGVYLAAEVGKTLDLWSRNLSLSTNFEYVQPSYTPIGKLERRDVIATGMSLDANVTESFSLGFSSDYSISSFSTEDGSWSLSNQLSVDWQTVVDTTAAATWTTKEGGITVLGLDLGLAKKFMGETLTAALDFSTAREIKSSGSPGNYASVSASLGFTPGESTALSLNYSYPFTFGPLEGRADEKLGWELDYSRDVPFSDDYGGKLKLSGKGNAQDLVGGGYRRFKNQSEVRMDFDQVSLGRLGLTPYISLSWKGSNSSHEITGEISGRTTVLSFSSRTTLSRTVGFSPGSNLVEYKDQLRGKVSYETDRVTPEVSYSISRNLLTHPNFGRRSEYSGDLTLGAKWRPLSNVSHELRGGVKYRSEKGFTYNLKDVLNWKLTSKLTPEVAVDLKFLPGTDEWDFSVESGFSYPIRELWGISFTSGFNWGIEETGDTYNSFYGSAGLQVKF
ncbi:hypothetical protein K9M78_02040 [Candidatus Bipolaricaulota bacterium]|nr:hypothetical protein [Candidatus Bipolaricaulota bacterium]